ncbi:hypothetical protein ILUMI_00879 [Ignelater luminosus]|uniref:CLIP domain-containing serine protease n=1 Tax=Ignelater luminosus TaxID=2038154 RepID=A0A8K0DFE0_IGNLU|nr:hypothetical protein ILUMI_00879 [Ignelater luminosus]
MMRPLHRWDLLLPVSFTVVVEGDDLYEFLDCPALNSLLEKQPISQDTIDYLRKAQCGFVGKQPKLCCAIATRSSPEALELLPSRKVCGKQNENRITDGELTTIRELPWMVLLEYQKSKRRGFSCGGFLINNRYILTAAHCFLSIPNHWKLISVRLGEHDLSKARDCEDETPGFVDCSDDPLDIAIEEKIPHDLYDPNDVNQAHDIALLRLSRKVDFTSYIKPICLPLSQELRNKYYVGENLTVAGWGKTETRSQSNVKLKAQVPVISKDNCAPVYASRGVTLVSSQVCAGGVNRKDACTGDSGGPLVVVDRTKLEETFVAYGIVSFGSDKCGAENFPGVYTRVADYIDWIIDHIKP